MSLRIARQCPACKAEWSALPAARLQCAACGWKPKAVIVPPPPPRIEPPTFQPLFGPPYTPPADIYNYPRVADEFDVPGVNYLEYDAHAVNKHAAWLLIVMILGCSHLFAFLLGMCTYQPS